MSEALLLVAEGYEQIAAGIRKMVAAQKDTPKKEEKPVKKAEKKETPVADTPKEEAAPKETAVDRKTVRAFLADKSRSGKTSEVKNLIEQFGFQKLSDVPDENLPEQYEKAQLLYWADMQGSPHRLVKDVWNALHRYCWRSSFRTKNLPSQQRGVPDMRWQSTSSINI